MHAPLASPVTVQSSVASVTSMRNSGRSPASSRAMIASGVSAMMASFHYHHLCHCC